MKYLLLIMALINGSFTFACTSYLVTKGASKDGSTMITYAADSHIRYGELYFRKRAINPPGTLIGIYDRSTNKLLCQIPDAPETYQVIGFMNEHQVSMGETTFDGRKELHDSTGLIDYGSLMFLALQRSKTAREAIKTISELVAEYGYYSSGESFSIADKNEVWIMEIIGKGTQWIFDKKLKKNINKNKGAVWVAIRIPEGYVSAHANHARITTFPFQKSNNWLDTSQAIYHSSDVIRFAREMKYFNGNDSEFSFSDTYAPLNFGAARFCEIRVWTFFNRINNSMSTYFDYAKGTVTSPRMPLYVKPDRKLDRMDLIDAKRDYLQNTPLDMTKDPGAGPFELPYRWRPLTWKVDGKEYFHERATVTQQTGFSYVAQARNFMPNPIGGIIWFGVDDAGSTVHVPFYCGISSVPQCFAEKNGTMTEYSPNAAFWIFNRVANFAYLRYNEIIKDIRVQQQYLESTFSYQVPTTDQIALELYKNKPELAINFITLQSHAWANTTVRKWHELSDFLLVKYIDGNVKQEINGNFIENGNGYPKSPKHPGYPEWWLKNIIEKTGSSFEMKN